MGGDEHCELVGSKVHGEAIGRGVDLVFQLITGVVIGIRHTARSEPANRMHMEEARTSTRRLEDGAYKNQYNVVTTAPRKNEARAMLMTMGMQTDI